MDAEFDIRWEGPPPPPKPGDMDFLAGQQERLYTEHGYVEFPEVSEDYEWCFQLRDEGEL